MTSPTVDLSHGITVTFGTSGYSALLRDITGPGASRESIETSYQGTMTAATFTPDDLVDWGEFTFVFDFNPDDDPPIKESAETITITWPAGGANWAFTGFVTSVDIDASHRTRMMINIGVKVSGDISMTDAT